jgi:hypothetical protein
VIGRTRRCAPGPMRCSPARVDAHAGVVRWPRTAERGPRGRVRACGVTGCWSGGRAGAPQAGHHRGPRSKGGWGRREGWWACGTWSRRAEGVTEVLVGGCVEDVRSVRDALTLEGSMRVWVWCGGPRSHGVDGTPVTSAWLDSNTTELCAKTLPVGHRPLAEPCDARHLNRPLCYRVEAIQARDPQRSAEDI